MKVLSRVVATVGLAALVLVALVWWTGRPDHSGGDAQVLVTGLEVPWGLAFLPDGDAIVGERETGRIYQVPAKGGSKTLVATVPGVVPGGEGGLLGIALDPLFIHSGHSFVYAYLTAESDNRVVRFHLDPDGSGIYDVQVILDGLAKESFHDGGALAFGPDGQLYVGVGDAGVPDRAQDPASLNGKILRMTTTGQPPLSPANPDPDSLVWSMGHRNVQGIAWDSKGRMYATEFGQNTFDEVNRIEPGKNYGWPVVEGLGDDPESTGYTNPIVTWSTDEASPSGIAIAGDTAYVGALAGQRLWRVPLSGGDPESVLEGQYGRLRNVQLAPDGSIWITTSNRDGRGSPDGDDDRILRVQTGSS
ncbi:MAG: PQQ-dependent sugar dehydrogenase [Nocardioides sp.]